jgi:hypothetical protein
MAWERRGKGGSAYFYLCRRGPGGAVVKGYFGHGPLAEAAAGALARRRAFQEAGRRALRDARDGLLEADRLTAELDAAARVLTEAVLLSEGFHRRNYGKWRRRHGHGRRRPAAPAGGAG